ncbi:hypothetical protein FUB88_04380 [Campylobacter jejuni]|nr:hypothetical protein [Campylobacter jejuni]ECP6060259.1 hypothetical protein [Campylobacter jejuni]
MKNTVFVFEDNIIFEINIFEKSNKEDFRYFLDENSNLTKSTKNDYCGSKTKKFFQRLYADGICRRKNKISIWKNKTSIKVEILFFYKP